LNCFLTAVFMRAARSDSRRSFEGTSTRMIWARIFFPLRSATQASNFSGPLASSGTRVRSRRE